MRVNEMMAAIASSPEAVAMVDRMLANHNRELSFGEVIALVYDRYFGNRKDDKNES
jgi:uncharacterized protein YoaH (UPF0181 family)